jgi:hypothetical protein
MTTMALKHQEAVLAHRFASNPSTWRIEVSDNGWTTDIIGLRWLQKHFIPLIRGKSVGKYSLLVFEGHGSHLTPEFKVFLKPSKSDYISSPTVITDFNPPGRRNGSTFIPRSNSTRKSGMGHFN